MMRLFWTPESLQDREEIMDFVALDKPGAALDLDTLFEEKAEYLLEHPGMGRLGRVIGTREFIVHRNYILVYDVMPDAIRILRVLHAACLWPQPER